MQILTPTDIAAQDALAAIASKQAATGVPSKGEARAQLIAERLAHYRALNVPDARAARQAIEDATAQL